VLHADLRFVLQEQVAKTVVAEDLDQVGPPLLHWVMICGNFSNFSIFDRL
jgi:hypothetical protein